MFITINSDNWLQQLEQQDWTLLNIDKTYCSNIKKYITQLDQDNKFKPAALAHEQNNLIRNDRTYWLSSQTHHILERNILTDLTKMQDALRNYFRVGLTHFEAHFAIFDKGHFYHKHTDQKQNDNKRFFSFVLYLNEEWQDQDGGELVIYKDDHHLLKLKPEIGTMIIFKSELIHEVLTAHKQRASLTGWMRTS